MTLKYNSLPRKTLAEPLTASSTSFRLNNIENWAGEDLTASDFGTVAYGVIRDAKGTKVEFFAFDPSTIADADIDFTYRGLSFNGTNLTTEVSANKLEWGKGSIVELGTHGPQIFQWLQELIEGIAIAGSPNSTTSVKGIGKVSVAPADPDAPIFVGDNDPRIVSVSTPSSPQTNDEGKLVKLNASGMLPNAFLNEAVNVQEFSSSGTWTKPSSGKIALIQLWGAGGSGGRRSDGAAGGGGGGAYAEIIVSIGTLSATESVTIGSGGAAVSDNNTDGNDGGNTAFATYTAYGGEGGVGGSQYVGGGGGGIKSAGSGGAGGSPIGGAAGSSSNGGTSIFGGGGGGNGSATSGGEAIYGGGGGGAGTGAGGASVYGGGGGGSTGGTSLCAGGGGGTHTNGTTPSGGGGRGTSSASGAGGNGYCRVTVF